MLLIMRALIVAIAVAISLSIPCSSQNELRRSKNFFYDEIDRSKESNEAEDFDYETHDPRRRFQSSGSSDQVFDKLLAEGKAEYYQTLIISPLFILAELVIENDHDSYPAPPGAFVPRIVPIPIIDFILEEVKKGIAPFTKKAAEKLQNFILGNANSRGTRSVDVFVINKSRRNFRIKETICPTGDFSSDLFPDGELPANRSIVYGAHTNWIAFQGVNCTVAYKSRDGEWFLARTVTPYAGKNVAGEMSSGLINVVSTKGGGTNNQVRFIISDEDGNEEW